LSPPALRFPRDPLPSSAVAGLADPSNDVSFAVLNRF
jgi:hypothetical protein